MPDVRVTPPTWLWMSRTKPVRIIEIHATRGPTTPELQYQATVNWMGSPNNGSAAQGWGASCSYVLGRNGEMATVLEDNQMPTYSAGYGGAGSTYAIDEYGISYEWCQSPAQEPYADAQYERGAREIAAKCLKYGIPPVFVEVPRQVGTAPAGFVRHDRCENGYKLGKSDPGAAFDEPRFVALVKKYMHSEEDDMSDAQIDARITALLNAAKSINAKFVRADGQDEVYEIINGRRVWLISPEVAIARGMKADLSNVQVINGIQLLAFPEGQL